MWEIGPIDPVTFSGTFSCCTFRFVVEPSMMTARLEIQAGALIHTSPRSIRAPWMVAHRNRVMSWLRTLDGQLGEVLPRSEGVLADEGGVIDNTEGLTQSDLNRHAHRVIAAWIAGRVFPVATSWTAGSVR